MRNSFNKNTLIYYLLPYIHYRVFQIFIDEDLLHNKLKDSTESWYSSDVCVVYYNFLEKLTANLYFPNKRFQVYRRHSVCKKQPINMIKICNFAKAIVECCQYTLNVQKGKTWLTDGKPKETGFSHAYLPTLLFNKIFWWTQ
jgi:hypothetical protein